MTDGIDLYRQQKHDQHQYQIRQFAGAMVQFSEDMLQNARHRNELEKIRNSLLSEIVDSSKAASIELEGIRLEQAHQNLLKQYELQIFSTEQYAWKALSLDLITFIEYVDLVCTSDSATIDLLIKGHECNLISRKELLSEVQSRNLNVEDYLNDLFANQLIDRRTLFHKSWELGVMNDRVFLDKLVEYDLIKEHEVIHKQKELGIIDEKQWLDICYRKRMISAENYFPSRLILAEREFCEEFSLHKIPHNPSEELRVKANRMFDKILAIKREGQAKYQQ